MYSGTAGSQVVSAARGPEGHHRDENVLGTKRMFHCRPANHFSEANWTHFRACICCNAFGQGIDQVRQDRGRWCAIRWTCRHPSPRPKVFDWQKTVEKSEAVALQQSIRHASSLARNGRTILRKDGSSMRGSPILPLLELLPLLPFVALVPYPASQLSRHASFGMAVYGTVLSLLFACFGSSRRHFVTPRCLEPPIAFLVSLFFCFSFTVNHLLFPPSSRPRTICCGAVTSHHPPSQ